MEIQGQEVLSLQDTLHRRTHPSIRWCHCKILRPTRDFLRTHLQKPESFWFTSDAFLEQLFLSFWDSYMKFLQGYLQAKVVPERTSYCVTWGVPRRVPSSISTSSLRSDLLSWKKSLRNPEEQEDYKKGTLSNQPWLTRITPSALLGSWVLQPIKGMASLGTDFEKHAKWQESVKEPAAKNFCSKEGQHYLIDQVHVTS